MTPFKRPLSGFIDQFFVVLRLLRCYAVSENQTGSCSRACSHLSDHKVVP